MHRTLLICVCLCCLAWPLRAQSKPEVKFVADTLVVEAEGTFEMDPDLATLTFDISSQDKEMKRAYETATQSMQHIIQLADQNGLKKEDVSTGVLRITPSYDREHKNKAKAYSVHGQIALRLRDFSLIGPVLDGAVQEGIVDFRSLTYSLRDEEAAKQRAVAEAIRHAVGRASSALAASGQKVGPIRYASIDVTQLTGATPLEWKRDLYKELAPVGGAAGAGIPSTRSALPSVNPEKITVSSKVQCAFQIQ
jgi:uncharacterized protein YggE